METQELPKTGDLFEKRRGDLFITRWEVTYVNTETGVITLKKVNNPSALLEHTDAERLREAFRPATWHSDTRIKRAIGAAIMIIIVVAILTS